MDETGNLDGAHKKLTETLAKMDEEYMANQKAMMSFVDEQQKALFIGNFPLSLEDPGASLAFGICNMGVTPDELEEAKSISYEGPHTLPD